MAGLGLMVPLLLQYVRGGLALRPGPESTNYLFLAGVFFVMAGVSLFTFNLLIHAAATARGR